MGTIHRLIRDHGRDVARTLIDQDQIPFFQVAANVLADESTGLGLTYSGFCLTALPHRRLADDQPWVRSNAGMSLLVEPGRRPKIPEPKRPADYETVGVPYGAKARLILLYLQTEALKRGSPVIELGRSMNQWLTRMGVSAGGATYKEVRNQADRISRCRLTFDYTGTYKGATFSGHRNEAIVRNAINLRADDLQGHLWDDTVELSGTFFRLLKEHPVPVAEPAIRQLASKSLAFDLYVWLAYRLHVLENDKTVSWPSLFDQFGAGTEYPNEAVYRSNLRAFKPEFRIALSYALAAYEDARVDVDTNGLILHPSRPPVPEREIARLTG